MKKITAEEFKRVEEQADLLAILKITPFAPPKSWATRSNFCGHCRKNNKNSRMSSINWERLAVSIK